MSPDATALDAPARRSRRSPGERLIAALGVLAGGTADVVAHRQAAWASITFSGTRHTVELAFDGEAAIAAGEELIAALPEHEFAIPGQLVADATIVAVDHALLPTPRLLVTAELLLLEDC